MTRNRIAKNFQSGTIWYMTNGVFAGILQWGFIGLDHTLILTLIPEIGGISLM